MKDNKKINKTRKNRGYAWEKTIVNRYNLKYNWEAMRLGGASSFLPDVLLIHSEMSTIISVEAKSGTTDNLYVPWDQIERCYRFVNKFKKYDYRYVMLAFKFSQVKRISSTKKTTRPLREYFYRWDGEIHNIADHVCTYDGKMFQLISNGKRIPVTMEDFWS